MRRWLLVVAGCGHPAPHARLPALAPADAQASSPDARVSSIDAAAATPLACPAGTRLQEATWTYMEGNASAPVRWCELPDGTKHGLWRKTLANGQPVEEAEYDHDKLTGLWTRYFFLAGGGLDQQGHYVDGVKDGVWHKWWGSGTLAETVVFDHGRPVSSSAFHPNGQLEERGSFVDGLLSGTWEWFAPDGSPTKLVIYARGKPVKAWRWKGKQRTPLPLPEIDSVP